MAAVLDSVECRVFARVVCAVDRTALSLEAVRQAGLLGSELGRIELVGVAETLADEYSPYGNRQAVTGAEHELAGRLAEAKALCPRAATELLHGPKVARLLDLLDESSATLVAVRAGNPHRGVGIVCSDVATEMLHRAPTSVLVARATSAADAFPRSVVVGYDGSQGAAAALAVGRDIADRFDAHIRVVTAGDAARTTFDELANLDVKHEYYRSPVDALLAASAEADLLVVGSRGLHGFSALGSVSERVGHRATCSVLVVRDEPTAEPDG